MLENAKFYIPYPNQTERSAAVVLRGHRFGPIRDGWILVFEDNQSPPSRNLADQLCIVMTADGQLKARILKPGRRADRWDLLTHSGDPELDQPIAWAERVTTIIPHDPTPAEAALLWNISGQTQNGRQAPEGTWRPNAFDDSPGSSTTLSHPVEM